MFIERIKDRFKKLFFGKNIKYQTFTYYVPAPPTRDTGYREKQFDRLFFEFINQGYQIISFKTQAHYGQNCSGMWLVFLVSKYTKDSDFPAFESDIDFDEIKIEREIEFEDEIHNQFSGPELDLTKR